MLSWLLRRLLQAALVMLAMSLIVFVGLNLVGDPVEILLPPEATAADRIELVTRMGLDQPIWHQYMTFLGNALTGDLGTSFIFNRPAMDVLLERLPATLELAVFATLISVVLGVPLGIYAGSNPDSKVTKTLMAGSIIGFSIPTFWLGLILIVIFSVQLGWLPSSGRGDTVEVLGVRWSFLTLDGLSHMVLPATNLALFNTALIIRLVRAVVREIWPSDYMRFAIAKGLSARRVVGVHLLKNTMIPVVTIVGIELGHTIAFAVVTETIFGWPGTGKLVIDSINNLDRPVVVAYLVVIVFLFIMINLIVDFIYTLVDPRISIGSSAE